MSLDNNRRANREVIAGDQRPEPATHTPGPWDYVPSTEHHGPYVTSQFGSTICDCYLMSQPGFPSVRNGGPSRPVHYLAEMADPNARLIAAAPDLLAALQEIERLANEHGPVKARAKMHEVARAAIAKATGGQS